MGVDQSPGGRNQPFYNVLGDDGSQRYAAHSKLNFWLINIIFKKVSGISIKWKEKTMYNLAGH